MMGREESSEVGIVIFDFGEIPARKRFVKVAVPSGVLPRMVQVSKAWGLLHNCRTKQDGCRA